MSTRTNVYTLVCYRPNGSDYCRGCLMGSSGSDHEVRVFFAPEDAAKFWAGRKMLDKKADREFCEWEVTLLIDGFGEYDVPDELYAAYDGKFESVSGLADAEFRRLCDDEAEKERQVREAAARAAEKRKREAEAAKEAAERSEFERLKRKYATS